MMRPRFRVVVLTSVVATMAMTASAQSLLLSIATFPGSACKAYGKPAFDTFFYVQGGGFQNTASVTKDAMCPAKFTMDGVDWGAVNRHDLPRLVELQALGNGVLRPGAGGVRR